MDKYSKNIISWILSIQIGLISTLVLAESDYRPCNELSKEFKFPCRCALGSVETVLGGNPSIYVDCDGIVFSSDLPSLPYGAPIVSFSQKNSGHQALPSQVFTSTSMPLRKIDLSNNALRKLTESSLTGFKNTLVELRMADNLLGDTLNPIFSSNEFHGLSLLKILDLSGNRIRAIEEGIFEGCGDLNEVYLDRNSMTSVPSSSLNGPRNLRILSLKSNRIGDLKNGPLFPSQQNLEELILDDNLISTIESGSFAGLKNLKILRLARNKLKKFNSDALEGIDNVEEIDFSQNFIEEFPTEALSPLQQLRFLNLSSNLIQEIHQNNLAPFVNLNILDLSRNSIANLGPGTFLGLKKLKKIDISVNSLRTVEDDAFEGLDELQELNLKDNNILLIPASALGRLPKLTSLQLDYNRIAALSGDLLRSIAAQVTTLVISKNIIRELPQASFQYFQQLERLDLSRNLISNLNSNAFLGLESSLTHLDLSRNKISAFSGTPLSLTKLKVLDLSENNLAQVTKGTFNLLSSLSHLNLSSNQLRSIPADLFQKATTLESIDLSYTSLKVLPPQLFSKLNLLKHIHLAHNSITEVATGVFSNLPNLTTIDLSSNNINNIRQGAFVNVMTVKKLILRNNHLSSFKGEIFNTGTSLETLDISNNHLSYLYPSSFRIHPRLREIHASNNKFVFFPAELIATLQFLEYVDLSQNSLKTVDELDFARLPRLKTLNLAHNQIESISEMAFHNSTQLQVIDLSHNNLDRLGERTFEGIIRLQMLNLDNNLFSDLPETVFDRSRVEMLECISLARNKFKEAPLESLKKQYFFISSVDLSHNKIEEISGEDSIMVNIKKFDLSFNPLSEKSIRNILGEPKTVRELNLAGTGITNVVRLETPFLNSLNLSYNNITELPAQVFDRTTLLETLDLSNNLIPNISDLQLHSLKSLQTLNLSHNPISVVSQSDFEDFHGTSLKTLSIHDLPECTRLEKGAFKSFSNLNQLEAYGYPKLGYLDIHGFLQKLVSIERINIETKDAAVGGDQFSPVLHPRLKELGISGSRLRSISSGTFSTLKAEFVEIRLRNTSVTTLPPALFFAVPRSSKIVLDVSGSQLTTLSPQFLSSLEDRRGDLKIIGLESNPIVCDCGARALRRWLPHHMTNLRCMGPDYLKGKYLVDIGDDELTCDPRVTSTTASTTSSTVSTQRTTKFQARTTEPEIIWSLATTVKTKPKPKPPLIGQFTLNNEDTLIISIVGGVIAFITILIIIICIIRLRMSSQQFKHGPDGTPMGQMMAPGSSCACSVKGVPPMYSLPPSYATLPYKMQGAPSLRPSNYSTLGRLPYQPSPQQYMISGLAGDEKIYR
ncbi:chaoptin [Coccinella septempunctata]|uniref:chaoptin n=1 Tax=Coccinella septempunctata TaxID=41139 RepID=UPI001D06C0FF|nr:chaoptin [Coccinella septempunctata]